MDGRHMQGRGAGFGFATRPWDFHGMLPSYHHAVGPDRVGAPGLAQGLIPARLCQHDESLAR